MPNNTSTDIANRFSFAKETCVTAGAAALAYFQRIETLTIEQKGHQDLVSEADKNVELLIRKLLAENFPDDAVVGEEHDNTIGTSGYTWVIDPIDGTANFVTGIPAWTVVLACVRGADTCIGVILDPVHNEVFAATQGGGAFRNDTPMRVSSSEGLHQGSVGVGFSNRVKSDGLLEALRHVVAGGGVFYRNASGALSLAYVADGRLIGYIEEHMNAWDCLAGQLLVQEAGGKIEAQDARDMILNGGRVVAATPTLFDTLVTISDQSFA